MRDIFDDLKAIDEASIVLTNEGRASAEIEYLRAELATLKEQNALLTIQVQRQREALERVKPSIAAGYELTARLCGIASVHEKDGYELIRRESVMDFIMRWRQTIDAISAQEPKDVS